MNSHHRWLLEQLPQWERDGLLTADAARTLRERHTAQQAAEDSHTGLAQIAMGALGALLIGSGLIAVIGYNWDDFSRPVRLLFAFLPLLAAQIFSLRVLQRGDAIAAWVRETAALLQVLFTGACIAIVSQIYNLGGEWPDFLFWWMLLSLPLAWVLRSRAVAIFYLAAIAVWSLDQMERGRPWYDSPLMHPVLLLGLLPLWPGWPPKTAPSPFMRWMITISAIFGLCASATFVTEGRGYFLHFEFETAVWLWTLTAAALTLFPLSQNGMAESLGRKPQVVLGSLWLLGYGAVGTFHDANHNILEGMSHGLKLSWAWGLLAVLAVFVVLAVLRQRWAVLSIATIGLLPMIAYPFATMLNWVFTLYLFGLGITLILLEFIGHRGAPRLGAALLSVLIIARMSDSHFSLLTKGLIFITVGVAFIVFNIAMSRHRRQQALAKS